MAEHKTRFTVWMDPEVLRAAKARALQDGITVSEVLATAAQRDLIDANRQNTDAQILQAVERVFNLIQRIDRRHIKDDVSRRAPGIGSSVGFGYSNHCLLHQQVPCAL